MSKNSVSGIYVIANVKNGKVYIGQAQDLSYRWRKHKERLKRGSHPNPHLQSAWNKYGEKNFRFQVLEYCLVKQLNEREQHYLDIYMPKGICYNISIDAVSPMRGRKLSEDAKRKISELHTGNQYSLGRKANDETRHKLSEARKGENNPFFGKHPSEESRRKSSEAHKGKSPSAQTRVKLSEANKGKTLSLEHRAKIGAAHKGKIISVEARLKMSEAAFKRGGKFILTDPNGIEYAIMGLSKWCRENGFDQPTMSKTIKNGKTYRGWKCRKVDNND